MAEVQTPAAGVESSGTDLSNRKVTTPEPTDAQPSATNRLAGGENIGDSTDTAGSNKPGDVTPTAKSPADAPGAATSTSQSDAGLDSSETTAAVALDRQERGINQTGKEKAQEAAGKRKDDPMAGLIGQTTAETEPAHAKAAKAGINQTDTMERVHEVVQEFAGHNHGHKATFGEGTNMLDDLGIKRSQLRSLADAVGEEFSIKIKDNDVGNLTFVRDVTHLVLRTLAL